MARIRIFETPAALAHVLAGHLARTLTVHPALVLGLATGRTPIPLYRELARLHAAGRADFSRATTFNLDEFLGVGAQDPRSYRAFMQKHLFGHINLAPRRIHFLNGAVHAGREVQRECDRYERAIERAGGIDVQILGLGTNGHIEALECVRVEWLQGADGRWTMQEMPDSAFELKADLVLLAMGFLGPVRAGMVAQSGVTLDPRGNVAANTLDYQTSLPKVFAAGDMRRGQSLVVWAIREGRQCARAIDQFLMGSSKLPR